MLWVDGALKGGVYLLLSSNINKLSPESETTPLTGFSNTVIATDCCCAAIITHMLTVYRVYVRTQPSQIHHHWNVFNHTCWLLCSYGEEGWGLWLESIHKTKKGWPDQHQGWVLWSCRVPSGWRTLPWHRDNMKLRSIQRNMFYYVAGHGFICKLAHSSSFRL